MIVRMKKATVLCVASDRDRALSRLRDLGVLHITPTVPPAGSDLDAARADHAAAERVGHLLRAAGRKPIRERDVVALKSDQIDARDIVERTLRIQQLHRQLEERRQALRRERSRAELFGEADTACLGALREAGVRVRVFRISGKRVPSAPEGAWVRVLRQDAAGAEVAVFSLSPVEYPGVEHTPPARPLSQIDEEIRTVEEALHREGLALRRLATRVSAVEAYAAELKLRARFLEVRAGMGVAGEVLYLQGFCPEECVDDLREEARQNGWGLWVDDPAAGDRVPTLIRNPRWIRPIESLFRLIRILPGYHEPDVSASFLLFMSLFFAMIVGDAGYGLVFLILTWLLRWRLRKAPREPLQLLTIFSVATVLWGAVNGAFFGVMPADWPRVRWLGDHRNVMHLCLLLGAIHLSVAHLWNLIRLANRTQAIVQAGWTATTWTVFFAARSLLLRHPFPPAYVPVAVLGLLVIVVFMTPWARLKSDWVNHLMLPLTLMSNFGDVLSYLRLFALSVAGLQIAGVFNSMAGSIGFADPIRGLVAALILFGGHALNIGLGALSVLVHGVRLNALEFSMHFGLEWSGVPYEPFAAARPGGEGGDRST